MKAVLRTKYGSPEALTVGTAPKPELKEDELLVRVRATTVNRTDCGILRGEPFPIRLFTGLLKPRSPVPGTDFAGVVEAVGPQVSDFKIGDRVWGFNDEGMASQAEYLTIRQRKGVVKIPNGIGYEEVVSCAEGAHNAYNFINKVTIDPRARVLVNGATGAIGSAAVQLLKYYGAHVTAVSNTPNIDLVKSLRADEVIDYQRVDFTKTDGQYQLILDAVGKSTFAKCRHLLAPQGVYISSELGPNAQNVYLPLITKLTGGQRVIFPVPSNIRKSLNLMNRLLTEGAFRPVIDRRYPMSAIKEAYHYVERGEKTGNVIVTYHHEKA
ncbi:MAG: NAD(P)-dependent alcohol dehydrogenase [Tunicatimonas sp.]